MILKNKIWAFIPARSGSKAIKDKNIKKFCGFPLIYFTLKISKQIKKIDKIIFSSDSKKYLRIAKKYAPITEHLRSKKNSKDSSTDLDVFKEFINYKIKQNEDLPEFFIHLRPTTPFRKKKIVEEAIKFFLKNHKKYTALRSLNELANSAFRTIIIKKNICYGLFNNNNDLDKINIARQSYAKTFIANGYVDILKTKTLLQKKIHGKRVYPFLTQDFNSDIDTLNEFISSETILKNNVYFKKNFLNS